ncbi:MHYT domain-containing protein [Phenylobacterium sp.]|uniref:MHYT domain-containing protein n=1 Tax=Phenylobacterium sp. TaxID=1871053 RepID=UPI0025E846CB|nr:MHYT domain-containing protein [Phenylobacterium sp.]
MFSVLTCIVVDHDPRLVAVAALVCATACVATFAFHLRSLQAAGSTLRWAWAGLTGLVAGSGVWATHFIAMLAYEPHLAFGYEPWTTAASWLIAVLGMGVGFALPVVRDRPSTVVTGGGLAGLAIALMHFTGVAAWRLQARVEWDLAYVVAAIAVGVLGTSAAFVVRARSPRAWAVAAPAGCLLLAIVGLHFTAMTAVDLAPDPTLALPAQLAGRDTLALATVVLVALILLATLGLNWMQGVGRRSTMSGLADALDAVTSGLAFYDPEGRVLSWNKAYGALMASAGVEMVAGLRRQDIVAKIFAAGWEVQTEFEPGATYFDKGRAPGLELKLPDGRWIRHQSFATQDGGGVSKMSDITEQMEAARILAEARDAAETANRAKSEFLANMSHEIRTPLNGVLGVAEVLAASGLSPKQQELVGVIKASGDLLNVLFSDLLDLAQAEAGMAELRPEPTALRDVAEAVVALYAPQAEQKGLGLRLDMAPDAGAVVNCDGMRLRQVLGNLLSNAVKFTETGEAVVALRREGDRVTFEVRDTGVGFDAAAKADLLGAFRQADGSSTRRHGGAGLGLAICRDYVALMGGTLDCSSAPGRGASFSFTLDLPALAEADNESAAPVGQAVADRHFRVLVVDDNDVNRQVLALILDAVGIEHGEAENGAEALDAVGAGGFDAVLMDIQMPVMDGLEATRRIRAWEVETGRARMPILIVSANGLQEHVDAGRAAGADGHLDKPVSVPLLLGALEPHVNAALAA